MNTPVRFEIAKLLKEKGFDLPCNNYTSQRDGDYFSNEKQVISYKNYNEITSTYSRPTIAEVIMWLYEKHGIWVSIILNEFSEPKDLQWMYSIIFTEDCTYSHSPEAYSLPTEAYSQAIEYTLKNFI